MYYFYKRENVFEFENPENYDIDLFFYDNEKLIHIASGGLDLNKISINLNNNDFMEIGNILKLRRRFKIRTNETLERDNLTTMEDYIGFFCKMAKKGFYSYDKVDINNPDCCKFQLISYPIYNKKIILNNTTLENNLRTNQKMQYDLPLIKKTKESMPNNFDIFDLTDFI